MNFPPHVLQNRTAWTALSEGFREGGRRAWESTDIEWGIWRVPESELQILSGIDFNNRDTIEMGCGTAYFSAWLARRGAKATGIDITPAQLRLAKDFQDEFGIHFPLIEGNAEETGLPSQRFDFALSEYGASIWCDPKRWIPEAARLLKPGGILVFLRNSNLSCLCTPDSGAVLTSLQRDYASLRRLEWPDDGSVEFQLPTAEMLRLIVKSGFVVEDIVDVFPPEGASETQFEYMKLSWAKRWPSEEIWRARRV
jgi:SAM-dependent methyltransferase